MKKIAIVTGGSFGIGLAIIEKLLSQNYDVYNLDINPSEVGQYVLFGGVKIRDGTFGLELITKLCNKVE